MVRGWGELAAIRGFISPAPAAGASVVVVAAAHVAAAAVAAVVAPAAVVAVDVPFVRSVQVCSCISPRSHVSAQ